MRPREGGREGGREGAESIVLAGSFRFCFKAELTSTGSKEGQNLMWLVS